MFDGVEIEVGNGEKVIGIGAGMRCYHMKCHGKGENDSWTS